MSDWTADDLDTIGTAEELDIARMRPDGSRRPSTTIWVVGVGDELYVRSYHGRSGSWFRHALRSHRGRISAGGLERDVTFVEPDDADHRAIDEAYRRKYARHGSTYVDPMIGAPAMGLRKTEPRGTTRVSPWCDAGVQARHSSSHTTRGRPP
jgi:hypothetical protein